MNWNVTKNLWEEKNPSANYDFMAWSVHSHVQLQLLPEYGECVCKLNMGKFCRRRTQELCPFIQRNYQVFSLYFISHFIYIKSVKENWLPVYATEIFTIESKDYAYIWRIGWLCVFFAGYFKLACVFLLFAFEVFPFFHWLAPWLLLSTAFWVHSTLNSPYYGSRFIPFACLIKLCKRKIDWRKYVIKQNVPIFFPLQKKVHKTFESIFLVHYSLQVSSLHLDHFCSFEASNAEKK